MNALLFAHVSIRAALLGYVLIRRSRRRLRTDVSTEWPTLVVVTVALLDAAWRLFSGLSDARGWGLFALPTMASLSDIVLTAGLIITQRRRRTAALSEQIKHALSAARIAGGRAEAIAIAKRMTNLIGERGYGGGASGLLRDLRAVHEGVCDDVTMARTTDPTAEPPTRMADAALARIGREIRLEAPLSVDVRLDFSTDLGPLRVEAKCLRDALHRVARNAMTAMPDGGTLRLRANVRKLSMHNKVGLAAGHWMRIELEDSGKGMSQRVLGRCRDPFFSTQPHGAGLGLSAVAAFATRADGALEIESSRGAGTSVTVWLPAALPSERRQVALPTTLAAALGTGTLRASTN